MSKVSTTEFEPATVQLYRSSMVPQGHHATSNYEKDIISYGLKYAYLAPFSHKPLASDRRHKHT